MKNFRSYLKENMLDSDREVNYYNSLAKERMKLMEPKTKPEGPKYHNAFIGKVDRIGTLNESRVVGNIRASDQIHDPSKYDELTKEDAPGDDDIDKDHQLMYEHARGIPHTEKEAFAVRNYTDDGYIPINKYLYGTNDTISDTHAERIEHMKSLLQKSTTPKPLTVFSGIKRSPEEYKAENSMIHMQNPAFTSTSLSHSQARGFATKFTHVDEEDNPILSPQNELVHNKHIVVLNIPQGAHAYYTDPKSTVGDERELVFHPGAKFHLWHKPTKFIGRYDPNTIYNHWYGRLVHDGIKEHPILEDDPWHPKNLGI